MNIDMPHWPGSQLQEFFSLLEELDYYRCKNKKKCASVLRKYIKKCALVLREYIKKCALA